MDLFEFCRDVSFADRWNHRRLAGFFQDVLTFGGEQEFYELHRVFPILCRSRHRGRILDGRNQGQVLDFDISQSPLSR
jgi:hypothetical protein